MCTFYSWCTLLLYYKYLMLGMESHYDTDTLSKDYFGCRSQCIPRLTLLEREINDHLLCCYNIVPCHLEGTLHRGYYSTSFETLLGAHLSILLYFQGNHNWSKSHHHYNGSLCYIQYLQRGLQIIQKCVLVIQDWDNCEVWVHIFRFNNEYPNEYHRLD